MCVELKAFVELYEDRRWQCRNTAAAARRRAPARHEHTALIAPMPWARTPPDPPGRSAHDPDVVPTRVSAYSMLDRPARRQGTGRWALTMFDEAVTRRQRGLPLIPFLPRARAAAMKDVGEPPDRLL